MECLGRGWRDRGVRREVVVELCRYVQDCSNAEEVEEIEAIEDMK